MNRRRPSRGEEEQLERHHRDPRRRRACAAADAHGRRFADHFRDRGAEGPQRGARAAPDQGRRGPHRRRTGSAPQDARAAGAGRAADHGAGRVRRRHRRLGRAVARGRAGLHRGHRGAEMISRRELLLGLGAAAVSVKGWAQTTTTKQLRISVPFPAGGGTDVLARLVAAKLRGNYASAVIIENRVGASGRTGVEAVKNAERDGTTLLFVPDFLMTVYPNSFKKLSYDPLADFIPIALVARSALAFAAAPALPAEVKTVREYVEWAKANPNHASSAPTAPAGTPHFVAA